MMSRGSNRRRSPASTAGLVRMIRSASRAWSAWTASATAKYDLPVPAGPMPKVTTLVAMASVYRFCPAVLGRTVRPRADRSSSVVSTSAGLSSSFTMVMVRPMSPASSRWPCSSSVTSSSNNRPTRSASSPSMVISLPRTTMCTPSKASSIRRSSSSLCPRRPTMRWFPGTRILTWVDGTGARFRGYQPVAGFPPVTRVRRAGVGDGPARSPRWPGQSASPEHVEVEMGDGVRRVLSHVEHEPVPPRRDPFRLGHLSGRHEDVGELFGVAGPEHSGVVDVPARYHQDVHRRLRIDVAKGHGVLGTEHDVGGDRTGDDAAEEAVSGSAHRETVSLLPGLATARHRGPLHFRIEVLEAAGSDAAVLDEGVHVDGLEPDVMPELEGRKCALVDA